MPDHEGCVKGCQMVGLPIKLLSLASPSRHLDSNQKGGCVQTPALSNRTNSNRLELQSPQMQRRRDWGPRCANYP